MSPALPALGAVVLAAGKGTRMKSERAKVLHKICGRPLAAFAVESARQLGADPITVVVGHQAEMVRQRLEGLFPGAPLRFAVQETQQGTGHAVLQARGTDRFGAAHVLILSGDVPLIPVESLRRLVAARVESNAAVALVAVELAVPRGYGRVIRDASGQVSRIVEEKDATAEERSVRLVNAGIYCVETGFLAEALDRLSPRNAQGEYYLTDLVADARGRGLGVVAVDAPADRALGINDRRELAEAEATLRREINTAHMQSGVTLRDPATAYIDHGIEIGTDTELGPSVALAGKTRLGRNVRVGQGCILIDAIVADGVEIRPYTHIEGATIGAGSILGPFARLRPGTELAEGVHIGNFVETKKARIGRRSKANHLTYLGDAVIGQDCNVGAGTITCNYDGVHKHETRLGDGVFIGSDTQLVAPVTVETGAYVGAGATITRNVPADSLAVSRAPMTIREGWAAQRRKQQAEQKKKAAAPEAKPPGPERK